MGKIKIIACYISVVLLAPLFTKAQAYKEIALANQYYANGELDKALELYTEIAKNRQYLPEIHNNYFSALLSLEQYKMAEKHIKRLMKYDPSNSYYPMDQGILYQAMGEKEKADRVFNDMIMKAKKNSFLLRIMAQNFVNKRLTDYALKCYQLGRKAENNDDLFALELANVYRILGRKVEMIEEYLRFGLMGSNHLNYVKNILQNVFRTPEDLAQFKRILIEKTQRDPNKNVYLELLIWVNLQQKDFYGAFVQARALDKKNKTQGSQSMYIADIAMTNESYDDAIAIYQTILKDYPNTYYAVFARRQIIKAREEKAKAHYPVDIQSIRELTRDYQRLIDDLGLNEQTAEAYRNKALLHAFYLDEQDSAIQILHQMINYPMMSPTLRSACKLDLADIYLHTGEPWEATLLYSQVAKANKDSPIGYQAKLKSAQLNYYLANFTLAKSHLDVLKLATSRAIANDAIALSLLIQNNTALDSAEQAMKAYAAAELLLYQNKTDSARMAFQHLLKRYPGHSLTDEAYWRIANIDLQQGDFEQALDALHAITAAYADDILADDAWFLSAKIYEEYLHDSAQAMQHYRDFLTQYPGSVYVAEARKRFRKLRGDSVN